jgi:hypothetical protein
MNPVACKLHRREKPTHSHHTASDCLLKVDKYDEIWASPYPPCPSPPPSVSGSSDEKEQQDDVNVVSSASDSGRHQLQQLKAINALVTSDERMPESIDDEPAEPDPSSGDLPDEWSDCWNALIATSTVVHGSSGGSGDIVRNYEPQSTMPLPVPATTSCVQHETSRTDAESIGFGLQQQQQFPRSSAEVVASTNCMATQLSELYFAKTTSYAAGWKNYMTVGRDNEGNTNNSNDDDKRKMEAETQNDVKDDPEAAATTAGEVRSQDVHRDLLSPQPPQSEPEDAFPKEVVSDSASAAVGCVFVEGDGSVGDSSPQTVDRWVSSIKHSQNSDVPERTSNGLPPVETL